MPGIRVYQWAPLLGDPPAIRVVTIPAIEVEGRHATRRKRLKEHPRCALSSTRALSRTHAHSTTSCTHIHCFMRESATRPIISARLQQQQLAEQEDTEPTMAIKPISGPTKKDQAASKTRKTAADRTSTKKRDADSGTTEA